MGRDESLEPSAHALTDLFLAMPPSALQRFDPDAMWAAIHLHDDDPSRTREDFQTAWHGVLRLFNLLQFLPLTWWTTRRGTEANLYDELPPQSHVWLPGVPLQTDGPETAGAWADALRFADDEVRADLRRLQERDVPPPEVGFELIGPKGGVLAEAELGWESHRVAVLLKNQSANRVSFESRGWRVLLAPADDLAESIAALLAGDPS